MIRILLPVKAPYHTNLILSIGATADMDPDIEAELIANGIAEATTDQAEIHYADRKFDSLIADNAVLTVEVARVQKNKDSLLEELLRLTEEKKNLAEEVTKLTEEKAALLEELAKLTEEKTALVEELAKLIDEKSASDNSVLPQPTGKRRS